VVKAIYIILNLNSCVHVRRVSSILSNSFSSRLYENFSISLTQLIKGLYYFSHLYLSITLYYFKGIINREYI
jgi:hypothetical protein